MESQQCLLWNCHEEGEYELIGNPSLRLFFKRNNGFITSKYMVSWVSTLHDTLEEHVGRAGEGESYGSVGTPQDQLLGYQCYHQHRYKWGPLMPSGEWGEAGDRMWGQGWGIKIVICEKVVEAGWLPVTFISSTRLELRSYGGLL